MVENPLFPLPGGVIDPQREFEVRERIQIEDGVHQGTIIRIEYRDEPYKYIDLIIQPEGKEIELKAGFPQNVSVGSALGMLLERFGVNLIKGNKVNPFAVLVGKPCRFQTITENVKTQAGIREYARVIRDSVKPL